MTAQVEQGLGQRTELIYEAPDVLSAPVGTRAITYDILGTARVDWNVLVIVPDRMTGCFIGREAELKQLADWADNQDSRACMLYGDAGLGKTTLVIDFLYRILEGRLTTSWTPSAITYYTAKQTRWGAKRP